MGNHHSKESKTVCPVINTSGPDVVPIVGSMSFHTLAMIIAGAAGILSCFVAFSLVMRHATHYSNPPEQKQIIRIFTILPTFSIVSILLVWQDGSPASYIKGALDVSESFPMAAFFILMSTYLVPEEGDRASFFNQLELMDKKGNGQGRGSLKWYTRLTMMAFQWIPISIITWIATVASLAANTYCANSNSVHFAHIWITVIRMFSTALAIIAIIRFYGRSKTVLKPRRTMSKLVCFKILVFLNFLQTFIFNFLISGNHLKPTKHLSFNDLSEGIPGLMLACEVAILSPFFFYAYTVAPYVIHDGSQSYHGGPLGLKAILSAANPIDVVGGLVRGLTGHVSEGGAARTDREYVRTSNHPGEIVDTLEGSADLASSHELEPLRSSRRHNVY